MFGIYLKDLPLKAKWLISLVLISFALNHISSTVLLWEVTRNVNSTAKEHFTYKTLTALLRMTHQHTFGHGTMYFITGAFFLFAGWSLRATLLVISLPFLGAWLDIFSWFMLKYGSEKWEILSILSGLTYGVAFATMFFASFHEMWFAKGPSNSK